ncbi:MAG: polysaccharide biosynthesis protein [Spirochaetia bacterium]
MSNQNRVYIIGAGFAGRAIGKEIKEKGTFGEIVAFFDDDPEKIGSKCLDIPIHGPIDSMPSLVQPKANDEALIAIPSAPHQQIRRIFELLRTTGFSNIRILPTLSQIIDGNVHFIQTRQINLQDLLNRTPVIINLKESLSYLRDKRVVITGAGGSIGSELSRQLLAAGAQRLYLFGHGENSIYEIERELRILQDQGVGEKTTIVPVIGELQDRDYMFFILSRLKADIVFHAAAYKHVPLLESNPVEAIKNNVFGTKNLVEAAHHAHIKRFVLISTDKAVDPSCVYGASKFIAEQLVLNNFSENQDFMVVRFGNVLGSRGSIIPLFQKQICTGGPVTITHPQTSRFFMTIPEASSLVLKAAGVGTNNTVYLLDMGEPLSIKELAEQMIRFYGYEPEEQIKIEYIGLRPGEKLTENLWSQNEHPIQTDVKKVLRLNRSKTNLIDIHAVLTELRKVCYYHDDHKEYYRNRRKLRSILKTVVPTLLEKEDEPEF